MLVKKYEYFKRFRCLAQSIQAQAAIKLIVATIVVWFAEPLVTVQTAWAAAPGSVSGTVTRVIDGDTIWVQTSASSKPLKVRIQDIDAPEICQAGGVAARDALKARVLGLRVTLSSKATDTYSRTIAGVDVEGENLGRWLVLGGHAWASGPFQSAGPYGAAQIKAQKARLGVFSGGKPELPKDFRKRHGSCFSKFSKH